MRINQHRIKQATAGLILFIALMALAGCRGSPEAVPGAITIQGTGVAAPVSFTMAELKKMAEGLVEADYFALNSYGTKEYFHYKGVWVWHLLRDQVGLKDEAVKVTFIGEDDYTVSFDLEDVKKEDYIDEHNPAANYKMILAWEQDGEEFDPAQGNPFQLVIGQYEPGWANKPYWVRNVKTIRID